MLVSHLHITGPHQGNAFRIFLFSCVFGSLFAEHSFPQISYPFQYYQSCRDLSLFNPAASGISAPVELFAGNHSYISYLKAKYSYFNANFRFGMGKNAPNISNAAGFRFSGYNEGKYISGTRLYGVYSFHVKLNNSLSMAGGIDLGYIHSRIEGTPSTGFLSEYVLDGNAGILVYSRSFHAGLAVNQLANNFIKPLQEVIVLYRHVSFSASKRMALGDHFQVSPFTWLCYPYYDKLRLDLGTKLQLLEKYDLMISYRFGEMASLGAGIQQVGIGKGLLSACITYNTPIRSEVIRTSTIEITLGYLLDKKTTRNGYFFTF